MKSDLSRENCTLYGGICQKTRQKRKNALSSFIHTVNPRSHRNHIFPPVASRLRRVISTWSPCTPACPHRRMLCSSLGGSPKPLSGRIRRLPEDAEWREESLFPRSLRERKRRKDEHNESASPDGAVTPPCLITEPLVISLNVDDNRFG